LLSLAYAARSFKSIREDFTTPQNLGLSPSVPPTQLIKAEVAWSISLISWSSVCLSETPKRWDASLRTGSWFCKVQSVTFMTSHEAEGLVNPFSIYFYIVQTIAYSFESNSLSRSGRIVFSIKSYRSL